MKRDIKRWSWLLLFWLEYLKYLRYVATKAHQTIVGQSIVNQLQSVSLIMIGPL